MGEFYEDIGESYQAWRAPDQSAFEVFDPTVYKLKDLVDSKRVEITIWPTLEGLCEENGITLDQLPAKMKEVVLAIEAEMRKFKFENHSSENILFICKCYHALQNETDLPPEISELKDELSSFQNFSQTLLAEADLTDLDGRYQLERLSRWIDQVNMETSPMQILSTGEVLFRGKPTSINSHLYIEQADLESEWVRCSNKTGEKNVESYVNKELKDYLKNESGPRRRPRFFHATTSAALPGIAEHHGLLSRPKLIERGGYPRSGERADFFPAVYVSRHLTSGYQYTDTSWFNEYPIHIGIKEEAENLLTPTPEYGETLGEEVPIDLINVLYVPFAKINEAKKWVSSNNLDAQVYPIEEL